MTPPETESVTSTDPDQFAAIHDPLSREANTNELLSELMGEDGTETTEGRSPEAPAVTTQPEAPKGEPAAAPQDTTTEAAAEPTVEELLKTATPLDYTVNGESKTFDGISVIPGQGAIVTEAALPQLRDRLQQAESARADARGLYGKLQEYETLTFKDRGGAEHRGRPAFESLYIEHAKQSAALELLAKTVSSADTLANLLTFDPATQKFQLNDGAVAQLQREIGLTARETEYSARNKFGEQASRATAESQQTAQRSTAITNAVTHWASQLQGLTPDDLAKAQAHFTRVGSAVVRPATPDEAQAAGVKVGELIIDHPLIHEWLADRAEMRKAAAAAATAATKTDKENTSRLAAANAGKKTAPKRTATAATTAAKSKADLWEEQKAQLQSGQWSADD